jgi:hypothetical protein
MFFKAGLVMIVANVFDYAGRPGSWLHGELPDSAGSLIRLWTVTPT